MAEAAFQDKVWRPNLKPLLDIASLRIVQCHTDPDTARRRIIARSTSRTAHADTQLLGALETGEDYFGNFDRVSIPAPSLDVDTTAGYDPQVEAVAAFVNRA